MRPFFPAVSRSQESVITFKKLSQRVATDTNNGQRVLNLGMLGRKSAFEIVDKTKRDSVRA